VADDDLTPVDRFVVDLIGRGEQARKRYATEGALPNEAHLVVLPRGRYALIPCPHCSHMNRLSRPVGVGTPDFRMSCVACGDLLTVRITA
jgi:ribosomal protein S27E